MCVISFSSMTSRVLFVGSTTLRVTAVICSCDVVFNFLVTCHSSCLSKNVKMVLDDNKMVSENYLICVKLSCPGRNQFHNCMPVTADEHSLYFSKISHSSSLVTDFAEIQLVFVGSDRPTVTESLYNLYI